MCGSALGIISQLFTGKKDDKPKDAVLSSAPTNVSTTSGDAAEAVTNTRKKAAAAQGYQSTIATSGAGDTSTATTQKKTLLGG